MRDPVQDARVAQDILDNVVFQAAVEAVDAKIIEEWRTAPHFGDRERAHIKQEILPDVLQALKKIISDGVYQEYMNQHPQG